MGELLGEKSIARIRRLEQRISRLQSLQLEEISAYYERRGRAEDVAAELALTLAVGENAARKRLALAKALTHRLPNTLAAMRRGEIDAYKASKVAEPTAVLSDEKAAYVDVLVADKLVNREPSRIRRLVNRVVHRVDPEGAEDRARRRRAQRRVELIHGDHGIATLLADLPAEVASAAYTRIDREAQALRRSGENRTTDQLRADVLADVLLEKHGNPLGPAKAEVYVHVDLTTLMGLRNEPGELAGHGPIPASVARQIAYDNGSTWRRIVTDPLTGAPIDAGRERYRPPAVTDEFTRVRDRECRFPGCHRPSQFTDLDHSVEWNRHGPTNPDNLVGLCRRHHRLKDVPGWKYLFDPQSQRLDVTTPSGHMRSSFPEPRD